MPESDEARTDDVRGMTQLMGRLRGALFVGSPAWACVELSHRRDVAWCSQMCPHVNRLVRTR
jgi:hypothetical protein